MNIGEDFDYLNISRITDSFKTRHIPRTFDELCIDKSHIIQIKHIIVKKPYYLLLYGDTDTGKTTLISLILKHYYKDEYNKDNIFYINGLKDYNINVIKQALETFCKSAFVSKCNRTIVVDDIDRIHDHNQYIIKSYTDRYRDRINVLLSCTNKQKIIKSLLNKLSIIYLSRYDYSLIYSYVDKLKQDLNITFGDNKEDNNNINTYIISISRLSIRHLLSIFEKLYYLGQTNYSLDDVKFICGSIDDNIMEEYTTTWVNRNIYNANCILEKLIQKGYNVIDILEAYFYFIKRTQIIPHELRLKVVTIISKYISIYHSFHENNIEMYFFTFELINTID